MNSYSFQNWRMSRRGADARAGTHDRYLGSEMVSGPKHVLRTGLGRFAVAVIVLPLVTPACAPRATVQSPDAIAEQLDLPPYDGPPAYVAVGPCENRTGGTGSFTVGDTRVSFENEIGSGMTDMLITGLANTGRFAVVEADQAVIAALERQRQLAGGADAEVRRPAAADIMVTCGVTEFAPQTSGIGAGAAGVFGRTLGAAAGGLRSSSVGIDIRLVDVESGVILSSFSVSGQARDVGLGALAARQLGPVGALGGFSNTPIEAAVRMALLRAVRELALRTPEQYFRPRN